MNIVSRLNGLMGRSYPVQQIFNDDVFLVSYPKSGNTWLSFLLANIMCIESGMDVEVNFFNIQDFVPEYHKDGRLGLRPSGVGKFPRIIKSHNEVCPLFRKAIFIVRDPRDVMVSYWHYLKGLGQISSDTTIKELVLDADKGVDAWVKHTRGWMERATAGKRVQVFRYEDFIEDPAGSLSDVCNVMGYSFDDKSIDMAVERSSLSRMKELEKTTRQSRFQLEGNDFRFVRKGQVGGNTGVDNECDEYINNKAKILMNALGYNI